MARKGTLNPKEKIQEFMKDGKTKRCLFVKHELEGEKYGKQCKNKCEPGRPRCRFHGGRAGAPLSAGGRFSKYNPVPTGLKDKFELAINDPEILNLTKQIALVDSQVWEICEAAQSQQTFDVLQTKKIIALLKTQKELIGQETERRVAMGSMIPAEQVLQIVSFVYDSINRHVPDPAAKRKIAEDLRKIVGNNQLAVTSQTQEVGN